MRLLQSVIHLVSHEVIAEEEAVGEGVVEVALEGLFVFGQLLEVV